MENVAAQTFQGGVMKLQDYMELHGKTYQEMEEQTGVSATILYNLCTGRTPQHMVKLQHAHMIERGTGGEVTVTDFLNTNIH